MGTHSIAWRPVGLLTHTGFGYKWDVAATPQFLVRVGERSVIWESGSQTRCQLLGWSQFREERCGRGETGHDIHTSPFPSLHYSASANILQKNLLDELQTAKGSLGGSESCARDFWFFVVFYF